VLAFLVFHLNSVFLGCAAMVLTIFAFPVSQTICEGILGVTYFSQLHVLGVFVVLGIAADDFFVLYDTWQRSSLLPEIRESKKMRMAFTLRKSVKAISVTSITTALAFFANSFSSIMPIASFGDYAALVVLINFVIICTFFPPLIIIYEDTIEPFKINFKRVLKLRIANYVRRSS
jgi:predicted RND superfamily exporter protein